MQTPFVLTLGESMVRLTLPEHGRADSSTPLSVGIGGAESNVALAVARVGVASTWMGHLGADDFGSMIIRELRGNGVRVIARQDPDAPTGLLVKEHRHGRPSKVRYYRTGSAASRFGPDDLDEQAIAEAAVLHLTGITPALGPAPAAAVSRAITLARAAGTSVSFDVNYRASLWSASRAREVLVELLPHVDVVFAGLTEGALVTGGDPTGHPFVAGRALAEGLSTFGPRHVVVKLGEHGALSLRDGTVEEVPAVPVTVLDSVGAGDAFVGGYLATLVSGGSVRDCLTMGARLGALVCRTRGDWEGLLDWEGDSAALGADVIR